MLFVQNKAIKLPETSNQYVKGLIKSINYN